jgi:LDH2 family malate/lactate/ureidoglycolate dehydrogenase
MKQPTIGSIRVRPQPLQAFMFEAARKVEIPQEQAKLLAQLLIDNDLRGVWTHGSRSMPRYVREIRGGGINPQPTVRKVQETPVSLMLDGDWGLGYFPMYQGTLEVIEKAKQQGMAALVTRHHGHIGAAGIYSRLTLEHDLLAFVTSGVQIRTTPDEMTYVAVSSSPMSFSAPADQESPLVVDAAVSNDLHHEGMRKELMRVAPGMALRALGYGAICQAWGGFLSGLPAEPARADRPYKNANQGGMVMVLRISLFADPVQFKREMDAYVRGVRKMQPMEGLEESFLPGGIEVEYERAYREAGIPIGQEHRKALEELAGELGIAAPWE